MYDINYYVVPNWFPILLLKILTLYIVINNQMIKNYENCYLELNIYKYILTYILNFLFLFKIVCTVARHSSIILFSFITCI